MNKKIKKFFNNILCLLSNNNISNINNIIIIKIRKNKN